MAMTRQDRATRRDNPTRACRALGLTIVMAALLWTGGSFPAHAVGYWRCSDGAWIAMGDPRHPMPTRPCGARLQIPSTQTACEQAGGSWGPAGIFPSPICRMPTRDGGWVCADDGECEGLCLAALTPAQRELLKRRQRVQVLGKCTPYLPVFGCMAVVREGFVSNIVCRD